MPAGQPRQAPASLAGWASTPRLRLKPQVAGASSPHHHTTHAGTPQPLTNNNTITTSTTAPLSLLLLRNFIFGRVFQTPRKRSHFTRIQVNVLPTREPINFPITVGHRSGNMQPRLIHSTCVQHEWSTNDDGRPVTSMPAVVFVVIADRPGDTSCNTG